MSEGIGISKATVICYSCYVTLMYYLGQSDETTRIQPGSIADSERV